MDDRARRGRLAGTSGAGGAGSCSLGPAGRLRQAQPVLRIVFVLAVLFLDILEDGLLAGPLAVRRVVDARREVGASDA